MFIIGHKGPLQYLKLSKFELSSEVEGTGNLLQNLFLSLSILIKILNCSSSIPPAIIGAKSAIVSSFGSKDFLIARLVCSAIILNFLALILSPVNMKRSDNAKLEAAQIELKKVSFIAKGESATIFL